MAATPKRKTSQSRRNNRRSHHRALLPTLKVSKQTGKLVPAGVVCADNPYYNEIEIIGRKAKKND